MRLGILTQYYPPEIGAPQRRLSNLARRFVERGHDVTVLTAMPNYPQGCLYPGYSGVYRREILEGITVDRAWVYPTNSVRIARRLACYFSFMISSSAAGLRILPRLDYLLTESPPLFLGISGYILARCKRARWIFNVSDLWPESAVRLGIIRNGAVLNACGRLEGFCYRHARIVTGQTIEIVESIRARLPNVRTYHLSNGVDTRRFTPALRDCSLREHLAPGARIIAVYAGLHGVAQGLEQLLDAAALLRHVNGLRVLLIGDGPAKPGLVARARSLDLSNVAFLGAMPHDQIARVLASADIALVPLKSELPGAVPSKIYEAMASGLAVVVAAGGEAARIIDRAAAGISVPPGDAQSIAAAVEQLCLDYPLRMGFGEKGRSAAIGSYDRTAIADRFIQYLEDDSKCSSDS